MSEENNAAPEGASEQQSIEDRLAAFDFDAPEAPAGAKSEPQAAEDDKADEAPEGDVAAQPAPDEDDPEVNLRDNTKVKLSELKRAYRPDWEKQVQEFTRKEQAFRQATQGFSAQQQQAALMLQNAVTVLQSRLPKPPDDKLLESDPFEYQKQKAYYDKSVGELQQVRAAQAYQLEQARRQAQYNDHQRLRQETEATLRAFPELRDPVKQAKFIEEVKKLGTELGFTPQELNGIKDHRLVRLIQKAVKADQYEKAIAKAKAKQASAPPPPPVQAPSRRRTSSEVQADTLRAGLERLRKNPNSAKAAEDVLSKFA